MSGHQMRYDGFNTCARIRCPLKTKRMRHTQNTETVIWRPVLVSAMTAVTKASWATRTDEKECFWLWKFSKQFPFTSSLAMKLCRTKWCCNIHLTFVFSNTMQWTKCVTFVNRKFFMILLWKIGFYEIISQSFDISHCSFSPRFIDQFLFYITLCILLRE